MSEYQYYEFLAVDRPLDARQQDEVRSLSTRAEITATSFVNEYHWGDFGGDPNELMERYYDAHLYLANWGTHRLMLRLPRSLLDVGVVEDYCVDDQVSFWTTSASLVLDMRSEDDAEAFDSGPDELLSAIIGVRTELATGDLRPLYLAWLAGYGTWERDEYAFDDDQELEHLYRLAWPPSPQHSGHWPTSSASTATCSPPPRKQAHHSNGSPTIATNSPTGWRTCLLPR
jgi:hypothetical protein